ncbi:MAG: hypothetical protein ACTSX7_20200 [Alphaproteobacteria bacterium]
MGMARAAQTGRGYGASSSHRRRRALSRLVVVFVAAALLLIGVFNAEEWYAERVLVPRYCGNLESTLVLVRETLGAQQPASAAQRRSYIIAAKLIYLIPQQDSEPVDAYLVRLRHRVADSCP